MKLNEMRTVEKGAMIEKLDDAISGILDFYRVECKVLFTHTDPDEIEIYLGWNEDSAELKRAYET